MAKRTQTFHVNGMTCTSCEVIIERTVKRADGVLDVAVSSSAGTCTVTTASGTHLQRQDIEQLLADTEYDVVELDQIEHRSFDWVHLFKIGITMLLVYMLASAFGLFSFDSEIGEVLSYPTIFGIGLVASVSSCIAVVGGLLLTFTATVKRMNPDASKWQLLRAHLFFNGGRLISYFFLGGVVAFIGSALAPSPRVMGFISLLAALVMIVLALDLLGLSGSSKWIPKMPKKWSHKIHDMAERQEWWIPFALGALTFFLPCGFTQSMQLYALTTGSFFQGAMTLFVFALGTMPAMIGIGALASFATTRGPAYKWFMLVAGSIVLLLGLYNVQNSMNLLGFSLRLGSTTVESTTDDPPIALTNGVQVVEMAVDGIDYIPNKITIQKDLPVQWVVDGAGATGCTSVLTIPSLGVTRPLARTGTTVIEFTPKKLGRLPFTCGMGMAYGEFQVVEAAAVPSADNEECDISIQTCSNN